MVWVVFWMCISIVWVVFCQDVEKATQGCDCCGCVVARTAICEQFFPPSHSSQNALLMWNFRRFTLCVILAQRKKSS